MPRFFLDVNVITTETYSVDAETPEQAKAMFLRGDVLQPWSSEVKEVLTDTIKVSLPDVEG
jgi:hypothetical protein